MFYHRAKSPKRGKTEMKRLHNNHQKIIARDLAQVWRWDSVLHLTPGITDGDHPIKIRSNLLNEGGWRTAACLHSISCNNYTPSGDWMSLVTFVLWFIHSKLAPINPGWSPTSRGNLKKKLLSGFFHCEIFLPSHRYLQKICWKACNLAEIGF